MMSFFAFVLSLLQHRLNQQFPSIRPPKPRQPPPAPDRPDVQEFTHRRCRPTACNPRRPLGSDRTATSNWRNIYLWRDPQPQGTAVHGRRVRDWFRPATVPGRASDPAPRSVLVYSVLRPAPAPFAFARGRVSRFRFGAFLAPISQPPSMPLTARRLVESSHHHAASRKPAHHR